MFLASCTKYQSCGTLHIQSGVLTIRGKVDDCIWWTRIMGAFVSREVEMRRQGIETLPAY